MTWMKPQLLISYETPDLNDGWQDEYAEVLPDVGHGVIDSKGRRWRVVDVWHSGDKHGAVDYGVHAYLEPVMAGSEDDRPGNLHPSYYRV